MRAPWLGDVLRDAGLRVATPVGSPAGRGREMDTIYGVVGHDTVTTTGWSDLRVAQLLRDGRPDLPGPLSQLGLRRDGTVDWIADGRCNHNGHGRWGNDAIGIEVYCAGGLAGRQEPWNPAQREAFVVAAAAILAHLGLGPSAYWNPRVAGHKETDPGRKQDPYRVDMDGVRADVAAREELGMGWLSRWPEWARSAASKYASKDTNPKKKWGKLTVAERLVLQERFDAERRRNG